MNAGLKRFFLARRGHGSGIEVEKRPYMPDRSAYISSIHTRQKRADLYKRLLVLLSEKNFQT